MDPGPNDNRGREDDASVGSVDSMTSSLGNDEDDGIDALFSAIDRTGDGEVSRTGKQRLESERGL
jgi:hypothetical protein